MNCQLDEHWLTMAYDALTLESALSHCGWVERDGSCWSLCTANGEPLLQPVAHRDQWRQFQLVGGAVPHSTLDRMLYDNADLYGPLKLVAREDGQIVCRLDVPEQLTGATGHLDGTGEHWAHVNPCLAWARAVTDCAAGDFQSSGGEAASNPATTSYTAVADELKRAGWTTTIDDGQLLVHVQLPGVYRQIVCKCDKLGGVRLAADLMDLANLEEASRNAVFQLAGAANTRLPLARMSVANSPPSAMLRAEVHLGATLIPGPTLCHTLHVLETAVSLTVRELEALRNSELAQLVLAMAPICSRC